jgi:hypothetical protein
MTKYIKDKTGKFAGSLPDEPKLASNSQVSQVPTPPASQTVEAKPAFGTPEWHEMIAQKRLEQAAREQSRAAAREVIYNFTDKVNSEFPDSRYFVFDEEWNPVAIEGYDNEVLIDLRSEEHGALADTLKIETENCVEGLKSFVDRDYKSPEGNIGVTMLILCDEGDNCQFRRPARGWAPSHNASPRCMSGKRPHCTCDTCF